MLIGRGSVCSQRAMLVNVFVGAKSTAAPTQPRSMPWFALSEIVEFVVTVEPDGPDPPDPKPPEPSDPLTRKLREALQTDPGDPSKKREHVATLAGFYPAMARHVSTNQVATVGDLLSDYRNAIPTVLPEGAIPAVRKVCGEEVAALAGDDPERKIDANLKSKLVDLFTRLASALDASKGK